MQQPRRDDADLGRGGGREDREAWRDSRGILETDGLVLPEWSYEEGRVREWNPRCLLGFGLSYPVVPFPDMDGWQVRVFECV